MMEFEAYAEKAKYYEKLTRQYREASDFLQALQFDNCETTEYSVGKDNLFGNCNELSIQTPAILEHEDSITKLFYRVNLVKDLGMDLVNEELKKWLIQEVKTRMQAIEDELASVFD